MTLTKEQIDQLFAFTQKKFVRHYDLQVELVDHLAEKIEELMNANEGLSFETALEKVYASFGLFGFAHVVQEKQKSLYKKNWRLWLKEVKQYFTLPKLVLTILVFVAAYTVGEFLSAGARFITIGVALLFFTAYQFHYFYNFRKATKKPVLLLEYSPMSSILWPFVTYEHIVVFRQEVASSLLFAILFVAGFVLFAAIIAVSKNVQQEASRLYPEAFA